MPWWQSVPRWPRRFGYPVVGVLLSLLAPLGFLCLRAALVGSVPTPAWIRGELAELPVVYAYLTGFTAAVGVLIGWGVGRQADHLLASAVTDPLTGLANRRSFNLRVQAEIDRAQRHGAPLSLLVVDLDHLKEINDGGGHEAGDRALCAVAAALRRTCRSSDLPARYGGDEFVILAPSTRAENAETLAKRIQGELAVTSHDQARPLSVSIGMPISSAPARSGPRRSTTPPTRRSSGPRRLAAHAPSWRHPARSSPSPDRDAWRPEAP